MFDSSVVPLRVFSAQGRVALLLASVGRAQLTDRAILDRRGWQSPHLPAPTSPGVLLAWKNARRQPTPPRAGRGPLSDLHTRRAPFSTPTHASAACRHVQQSRIRKWAGQSSHAAIKVLLASFSTLSSQPPPRRPFTDREHQPRSKRLRMGKSVSDFFDYRTTNGVLTRPQTTGAATKVSERLLSHPLVRLCSTVPYSPPQQKRRHQR